MKANNYNKIGCGSVILKYFKTWVELVCIKYSISLKIVSDFFLDSIPKQTYKYAYNFFKFSFLKENCVCFCVTPRTSIFNNLTDGLKMRLI